MLIKRKYLGLLFFIYSFSLLAVGYVGGALNVDKDALVKSVPESFSAYKPKPSKAMIEQACQVYFENNPNFANKPEGALHRSLLIHKVQGFADHFEDIWCHIAYMTNDLLEGGHSMSSPINHAFFRLFPASGFELKPIGKQEFINEHNAYIKAEAGNGK